MHTSVSWGAAKVEADMRRAALHCLNLFGVTYIDRAWEYA